MCELSCVVCGEGGRGWGEGGGEGEEGAEEGGGEGEGEKEKEKEKEEKAEGEGDREGEGEGEKDKEEEEEEKENPSSGAASVIGRAVGAHLLQGMGGEQFHLAEAEVERLLAVAVEHNCLGDWLSLSQKCGTDTDTVATVHTRFKHFHEWRHATKQQGTTISINTPNELRTAWTKPRFAFPDSERARRATHVIGGTWDKRDGAPVIVQTKDIGWTPDTDPDRGDLYSVLMMRESSSKCPAGGLDVDPVNLPDGMGKCKVVMRGMTAYVEGGHGMAVLGFATKFKKVRSCRNTSAWFVVVANGLGAVFVHMALVVSFKFNSELDFMKYQQNMIEDTVASQVFAATEKGGDT